MARPGFVYFVRAGDEGDVKIGWTVDLKARLAFLQCASPAPLKLLGCVAATKAAEGRYHSRFARHRKMGEWFAAHPEILAEAASLLAADHSPAVATVSETAARRAAFAARLVERREALGYRTRAAFAAAVRADADTIRMWEIGRNYPAIDDLGRLIELLDCTSDWLLLGRGPAPASDEPPARDWLDVAAPVSSEALAGYEALRASHPALGA